MRKAGIIASNYALSSQVSDLATLVYAELGTKLKEKSFFTERERSRGAVKLAALTSMSEYISVFLFGTKSHPHRRTREKNKETQKETCWEFGNTVEVW